MTLKAQAKVRCSAEVLIYRSNNRTQVALYYHKRHDPMSDTVTMRIFCVLQRGQIASHIFFAFFSFFFFSFHSRRFEGCPSGSRSPWARVSAFEYDQDVIALKRSPRVDEISGSHEQERVAFACLIPGSKYPNYSCLCLHESVQACNNACMRSVPSV